MYRTQCILAVLGLYVGLAHCFSWDIVLGVSKGLNFYDKGILTHSEVIPSADITSITYDPVYDRVLFTDHCNISSFDIATLKTRTLISREPGSFDWKFGYDIATATLFQFGNSSIYSFSLKPGFNNADDGKRIVELSGWLRDIAVDSCGGYVYWATDSNIERVRFDGSERELLIDHEVFWRPDLIIDQQTQKMYWIDKYYEATDTLYKLDIQSADFNGKNIKTLYSGRTSSYGGFLTVSKDFIYWRLAKQNTFYQLAKNPPRTEPKQFSINDPEICYNCDSIAVNHKVEDQTPTTGACKALTSLLSRNCSNIDAGLLCVHGTKVIGESVCKCAQGYTGERCDVSICQNYCFQGDCSVSDEQPKCRCNAGYSGERCQANRCEDYCLNNGVCSINEDSEPMCTCTRDYEGDRCEVSVSVFLMKCYRVAPTLSTLRDILDTDTLPVTFDNEVLQLVSEMNTCSRN